MEIEQMSRILHESFLGHAVYLANKWEFKANMDTIVNVLNYIDVKVKDRSIPMMDVERMLYHYIVNDFSHTPYQNFDQNMYQNSYPESEDDIEEIKYILFKVAGIPTNYFNKNVVAKHEAFDLQLVL